MGRSPARSAAMPRLWTMTAASWSWSVVENSRSAASRSRSARSVAPWASAMIARSVRARAIQTVSAPSTQRQQGQPYASSGGLRVAAQHPERTAAPEPDPGRGEPACSWRPRRPRSSGRPRSVHGGSMRCPGWRGRRPGGRPEPERRASRTARRRWPTAAAASPKSRSTSPITWYAMEASSGEGRLASTTRAPASASFGRAKTSGRRSAGAPANRSTFRFRTAMSGMLGDGGRCRDRYQGPR